LPKRSIIFLILGLTLHECGIASTTLYFDLAIPMSIFWSYGLLLFLAVLMLKFTQPILLGSHSYIQPNSVTRRYTLIHGAILAFLTIICTANVAVWGYYYDHHDRSYYADYSGLVTSGFKLSIAYHALFMLVALYAAVFLYFCLRKSKAYQHGPSSSSSSSSSSALSFSPLLPIVPAILAASRLVALASGAYYYDLWNYDGSSTFAARLVLDVLENLLPIVAFAMAIWLVGRAREIGGGGAGVPGVPHEQGQGWHGQPEYVQPPNGYAQSQEQYGMGQYGNAYAPGKP
jgi:hypothetical protein